MTVIKRLRSDVIPQIAAGEVVERPASVLKELLDNSIDANSKNIIIELKGSGLKSILVVDDGNGMSEEDLKLSVETHTTSKLIEIEDLSTLKTLGFRGEALSSICSVSKVRIKSCNDKNSKGKELYLSGGNLESEKYIGMNRGTSIEVSDLFFNIPARRKFLKSEQTEYRLLLKVLVSYVLGNPSIGFKLTHNDKLIINVSQKDSLEIRIHKLLGKGIHSGLIPISFSNERLTLTGYISKPQIAEPSKDNQYLYINNRSVSNHIISNAVKDAYKHLLIPKTFSPYILSIQLDPSLLDVNTHPRKEEVSFWKDSDVYSFVFESISSCLRDHDLTFQKGMYDQDIFGEDRASYHEFKSLKDSEEAWDPRKEELSSNDILQVDNTYIISKTSSGLLLVDQHAAHESILYEDYLKMYQEKKVGKTFMMKEPLIVDLSLTQLSLLNEFSSEIEALGLELDIFGNSSVRILGVPSLLRDHNIKKLIVELLDNFSDGYKTLSVDERSRGTIAFLSCRTAIKAGDPLTYEQMKSLLERLSVSKSVYTCPHGRPVKILMSNKDLGRLFKR